jgi:hypothetical protein
MLMKLKSIEPTPSPNSMKLNLDEALPSGVRKTYTPDQSSLAPVIIRKLLAIPGVKSLFHASDFIAVDRKPNADWQQILTAAREVFGSENASARRCSRRR